MLRNNQKVNPNTKKAIVNNTNVASPSDVIWEVPFPIKIMPLRTDNTGGLNITVARTAPPSHASFIRPFLPILF